MIRFIESNEACICFVSPFIYRVHVSFAEKSEAKTNANICSFIHLCGAWQATQEALFEHNGKLSGAYMAFGSFAISDCVSFSVISSFFLREILRHIYRLINSLRWIRATSRFGSFAICAAQQNIWKYSIMLSFRSGFPRFLSFFPCHLLYFFFTDCFIRIVKYPARVITTLSCRCHNKKNAKYTFRLVCVDENRLVYKVIQNDIECRHFAIILVARIENSQYNWIGNGIRTESNLVKIETETWIVLHFHFTLRLFLFFASIEQKKQRKRFDRVKVLRHVEGNGMWYALELKFTFQTVNLNDQRMSGITECIFLLTYIS